MYAFFTLGGRRRQMQMVFGNSTENSILFCRLLKKGLQQMSFVCACFAQYSVPFVAPMTGKMADISEIEKSFEKQGLEMHLEKFSQIYCRLELSVCARKLRNVWLPVLNFYKYVRVMNTWICVYPMGLLRYYYIRKRVLINTQRNVLVIIGTIKLLYLTQMKLLYYLTIRVSSPCLIAIAPFLMFPTFKVR